MQEVSCEETYKNLNIKAIFVFPFVVFVHCVMFFPITMILSIAIYSTLFNETNEILSVFLVFIISCLLYYKSSIYFIRALLAPKSPKRTKYKRRFMEVQEEFLSKH